MRTLIFSVMAIMLLATAAAGEERERIAALIERLGADEYRERAEATADLIKTGLPALPALEAATKSEDAEVRHRAERARAQILRDNHIFDGLKVTLRSDKREYPEGATMTLTLEITNISGQDKEITLFNDDVIKYSTLEQLMKEQSEPPHGIVRIEQIASERDLRKMEKRKEQQALMGRRTVTIKRDETITKPYVIKTIDDECVIETEEPKATERDEDHRLFQPLNPGTYEITCYLSRNEKPLGIGTVREFPVSPNRHITEDAEVLRDRVKRIDGVEYTTEDEELRSNTITIKILPGEPGEKDQEAEEEE